MKKSETIVVSAPCKVHLLGEWAVVWGKPALLTSVNLRIKATISPVQKSKPTEISKIINPIVKKELKLKKIPAYNLEITSDIPTGAHLGSSAAVSVVSIAALLTFLKVKWDHNLIYKLAYEGEKVFHGNPSGADPATVLYGGLVWFRKEIPDLKIIQQLPFSVPEKLSKNFVLINTGTPQLNTKKMIAQITLDFEKNPKLMSNFLNLQEKLTKELLVAIKDTKEKEVIRIIKEGEKNLETIGVCSPEVKKIIRDIEKAGGAAKICGAGAFSGPTGVLLCYHKNKSQIEKVAKSYNLSYFKADLGVEGLRKES